MKRKLKGRVGKVVTVFAEGTEAGLSNKITEIKVRE